MIEKVSYPSENSLHTEAMYCNDIAILLATRTQVDVNGLHIYHETMHADRANSLDWHARRCIAFLHCSNA
jgi:hypothetical protein